MDRWKDGKRGREWRNERIERLRKRQRGGKRERDEYREGWVKGGKVGGGMERWMADAVMGQRKGWRDDVCPSRCWQRIRTCLISV